MELFSQIRLKKMVRIIALAHVALLFGFVIWPYSKGESFSASFEERNVPGGPENGLPAFSASSPFNAFISENQLSGNSQLPTPAQKNHFNDYLSCHQKIELLMINFVTGYLRFADKIDPGFPKIRIIYPFHYFW